ncbi:MAG: hypothetical protein C0410_16105 [Anaerolinea sp.]|nr:hypothetical protein [Anaerolinea sp.]
MIKDDFKIDFEKKEISYIGKNKKVYSVKELYLLLQDTFDEPENMKYDIPIEAKSKTKYFLINGWTMDKKSLRYLKEGTITI